MKNARRTATTFHLTLLAVALGSLAGCGPVGPGEPASIAQASLVCRSVQIGGRLFYNDQRKFGRFRLRRDEVGASGKQHDDVRSPNFLGLLDATVEIYEIDKAALSQDCELTRYHGSTTVQADGSWSWQGQVCDSCLDDDGDEGGSISVAAKVRLEYCPAPEEPCFSVKDPGVNDTATSYSTEDLVETNVWERWHRSAGLDNPVLLGPGAPPVVLADDHFQVFSYPGTDARDLEMHAANVFASLVDVVHKVHTEAGIPFDGFNGFGDVEAIFPRQYGGTFGHSHQPGNRMCIPAPGREGASGGRIPIDWPRGGTTLHEYGHLVNYRAWQGFGKYVCYGIVDCNNESLSEIQYPHAALKEAWAEFVARATVDDVRFPTETADPGGCTGTFDFDPAYACTGPAPCTSGHWYVKNVEHALCDWYDVNKDRSIFTIWGDHFGNEDLLAMWQILRGTWFTASMWVRLDYQTATSYTVSDGPDLCDFASYHLATRPGDYNAIVDLLANNGIDCGI